MTPPIALQEIFAECGVKEVVFQPLLLEAALSVDDDGFVVFVNCDESCKDTYLLEFNNRQKGRYLPSRIRFSLAHELIHTFFYDTAQRPYLNRLNGARPKEIESLESACNFGASHLLLPSRMLKSDIGKFDVLTVDGITDLAERYQVSVDCLIARLERLEDWTPKAGLIALVREGTEGHRIKAVAKSVGVRALFKDAVFDADVEAAFGRIPFEAIKQRAKGRLGFDLNYSRDGGLDIVRCEMTYRRILQNPETFVLALRVNDVPRPARKHRDSNTAHHHITKLKEAIKGEMRQYRISATTFDETE